MDIGCKYTRRGNSFLVLYLRDSTVFKQFETSCQNMRNMCELMIKTVSFGKEMEAMWWTYTRKLRARICHSTRSVTTMSRH